MKWNFGDNRFSCVIISLIIAIPSLAYTFYLPALPAMAKSLGISPSVAKLSMTFLMTTAMASLLVIGPLSDRYGRKPVLITGLFINILACLLLESNGLIVDAVDWQRGSGRRVGYLFCRSLSHDQRRTG
ncbi:MAG: MFS transporter [Endozoicomonas sp.]|uniref:MFS transporter n=1 Tax=Endozoicomonas sp. TaxID=1892382 RepID=UPI003D9BB9D2